MSKNRYDEIDVIYDPEGSGAGVVITACSKDTGYVVYSWSLFKEFVRAGQVDRTAFLNDRHLGAARRLIDLAEKRIALEMDRLHRSRRSA